ncbi:MAG: COG1361 S-layer family protein [Candidatus Bathyarchaeia archaeon]|nr:COG1361 S-layer family protein [Candidatus Bathyarchaeota archaeon]
MLRTRTYLYIMIALILTLSTHLEQQTNPVGAVGYANVVATSVYWGSNPLNPLNVHPGDTNVRLSIVLANVGDDVARGVNATLFIGPPLTYTYYQDSVQYSASTVSKMAGDIGPGSSFTLGFTVNIDPNAKEGVYRYNLEISYRSARELQEVKNVMVIDVPVWRAEIRVQSVLTMPTKIYPGSRQVQVRVGIVNSGQGAARDLQLRMDLKPPFKASSSGSDRYFLGNLPAGQSSSVNFIVDVDEEAKFGKYFVDMLMEGGGASVSIGAVPIDVNEKVRFEVVSVTPTIFHAGDTGKVIRVELKNSGSVKAESVRVQLRVGNFFAGTLTDFLGTMLSGEVKVAFFTVDVDSKAKPGNYSFDLKIDWTQDSNALDDNLKLTFNVQPAGAPVVPIVLAAVGLASVLAYLTFKRRKVKNGQA